MADHIKYPKLYKLGRPEVQGLLNEDVVVQEKIDGANVSIWLDSNGVIQLGSRNRTLKAEESFRGFREHVGSSPIPSIFEHYPNIRLFGEWLVKHTVTYNEEAYAKFYLFDVKQHEEEYNFYWHHQQVFDLALFYDIPKPKVFDLEEYTEDHIRTVLGESDLGPKGEGLVIKPTGSRRNFFGAKLVTKEFAESNAVKFSTINKASDTNHEEYFVSKYCTIPRIRKVVNKITMDLGVECLDKSHTPRVLGTVAHDIMEECGYDLYKYMIKRDAKFSFKDLRRLLDQRIRYVFHAVVDGEEIYGY